MTERNHHNQSPQKRDAASPGEGAAVLVEVYKALKALAFYPDGHPLRDKIPRRAFQLLVSFMKGDAFSLVVGRGGIRVYGRDERVENTRMVKAFADELFAREIQRLVFLPDLTLADLTGFLALLSMEPQKILAEGGISKLLQQRGFQTVMVNEIDISAAFTKRMSGLDEKGAPADGAGTSGADAFDWEGTGLEEPAVDDLDELTVDELLTRMENETDADSYLLLSRKVAAKGQAMKGEGNFDSLFGVILRLLNQCSRETLGEAQRVTALAVFRELAGGEMADHLLDHLEDKDFMLKEIVFMVFNRLGEGAVDAVLCRVVDTANPYYRKILATALLRIGEPAVVPLVAMLHDARSRAVCAAAAVLGEMGARDAVKGLVGNLSHEDSRVRIESVRALAMIGGKEATEVLLGLLRGKDPVMGKQAVLWLGIRRTTKALPPLLQLIFKREFKAGSFALKRDAVRAVGRIGDHSALDALFRLVRKRHVILPGCWEELKLLAIEVIGQFGGDAAVDFLEKTAARGGKLGQKCADTLNKKGEESRRQS